MVLRSWHWIVEGEIYYRYTRVRLGLEVRVRVSALNA